MCPAIAWFHILESFSWWNSFISPVPRVWPSSLRYCCVSSSAASFLGGGDLLSHTLLQHQSLYTTAHRVRVWPPCQTRPVVAACPMTMASSQAFGSWFRACNTCALPSHFFFVSSLAFCQLGCSHYIYKLQLNATREQCLVWLLVLVCKL